MLTSLSFPSVVDVTTGAKAITFTAGATDVGLGVDSVNVIFDKSWQGAYGNTTSFSASSSKDSFADGISSDQFVINPTSGSGTYTINSVYVYDKAGNYSYYTVSDLANRGIQTSFRIIDNNSTAPIASTAYVTAPASVIEGNDLTFSPSLTIKNVSIASGSVTVTVLGSSTATITDIIGGSSTQSYSFLQLPAQDYTLTLPAITVLDDQLAEGTKTVDVQIRAPGQVFANGTDTTVVSVNLLDNDQIGTAGMDVLTGTAKKDFLSGLGGNDVLTGGAGADTLSGGEGNDVFRGTLADLAGDRITDLAIGDRINITDVFAISSLSMTRNGTALTLNGTTTIDIGDSNVRLISTATGVSIDLVAVAPFSGLNDFSGDGRSDLLWRNSSGALSTWTVGANGTTMLPSVYNAQVGTDWRVLGTADFNGDARADILWRQAGGSISLWNATSGGFQQGAYNNSSVGNDWRIAATGDTNGDGKDDLLWQHSSGAISTWTSTGNGFAQNSYYHDPAGEGWLVAGLADLNGDGRADIVWRNTDGSIATWMANARGYNDGGFFLNLPSSWHIDGLSDFNGDGRSDILWRHDNGSVSVWSASASGFDQATFNGYADPSWRIAQVGDFNGDGRADILWRNDNGALSTWQSNGRSFDQGVYNTGVPTSWSVAAHDFVL